MRFLRNLFKSRKKVTYYWDEPKWTPEMMDEVESIFDEYAIEKCIDETGLSPSWNVKLNTDIELHIVFDGDRQLPYICFFEVEADLLWERHAKSWVEFEHCDTFEYLLERLRKLPKTYGSKALGKSYSRHCMEQAEQNVE